MTQVFRRHTDGRFVALTRRADSSAISARLPDGSIAEFSDRRAAMDAARGYSSPFMALVAGR